MFFGEYEHTIDDKNRLTLPAKYREALADGVILTRGLGSCLEVWSRDDWNRRVVQRLDEFDHFSPEARLLKRYLFPAASDADLDKQGRVLVPAALAKRAGLGREVIVLGVHDHIEIWDRETWANYVTEAEGSADDVAERLAAKNV